MFSFILLYFPDSAFVFYFIFLLAHDETFGFPAFEEN